MSEGAIEPTRVISPGAGGLPATTGRQRFYQTYNTRYMSDPVGGDAGITGGGSPGGGGGGGRTQSFLGRLPNGSGPVVNVPTGFPRFLGGRGLLILAWMVAMAMVSLDEWHTNHILPRPARLWYTSLLFFILGAVSTIDFMVPLTNLFAIGMVIVLGYQYYQGQGQFGPSAAQSTAGSPDSTAPGGVNEPIPGTGTLPITPPTLVESTIPAQITQNVETYDVQLQQYIAEQQYLNSPASQE